VGVKSNSQMQRLHTTPLDKMVTACPSAPGST
jgi:hypothetical protein